MTGRPRRCAQDAPKRPPTRARNHGILAHNLTRAPNPRQYGLQPVQRKTFSFKLRAGSFLTKMATRHDLHARPHPPPPTKTLPVCDTHTAALCFPRHSRLVPERGTQACWERIPAGVRSVAPVVSHAWPFLHLKVSLHSQHHPPPKVEAEDVGKARTAKAEVKAATVDLKHWREESIRCWRMRNTTGSSSTRLKTERVPVAAFRKDFAGRDHCCLGCGKANVQCESCRCIDNVVSV